MKLWSRKSGDVSAYPGHLTARELWGRCTFGGISCNPIVQSHGSAAATTCGVDWAVWSSPQRLTDYQRAIKENFSLKEVFYCLALILCSL